MKKIKIHCDDYRNETTITGFDIHITDEEKKNLQICRQVFTPINAAMKSEDGILQTESARMKLLITD